MNKNQIVGLAVIVIFGITSLIGCNPDEVYGAMRKARGGEERVDPLERAYRDKLEQEYRQKELLVAKLGITRLPEKAREAFDKSNRNRNKEETGSYTNTHESSKTYVGKGSKQRSQDSGKNIAKRHDDPHRSTEHTPAENNREAFMQESRRLDDEGGPGSNSNYNRIESPGKKFRAQDGEARP